MNEWRQARISAAVALLALLTLAVSGARAAAAIGPSHAEGRRLPLPSEFKKLREGVPVDGQEVVPLANKFTNL
jgi:hypothetical protein